MLVAQDMTDGTPSEYLLRLPVSSVTEPKPGGAFFRPGFSIRAAVRTAQVLLDGDGK